MNSRNAEEEDEEEQPSPLSHRKKPSVENGLNTIAMSMSSSSAAAAVDKNRSSLARKLTISTAAPRSMAYSQSTDALAATGSAPGRLISPSWPLGRGSMSQRQQQLSPSSVASSFRHSANFIREARFFFKLAGARGRTTSTTTSNTTSTTATNTTSTTTSSMARSAADRCAVQHGGGGAGRPCAGSRSDDDYNLNKDQHLEQQPLSLGSNGGQQRVKWACVGEEKGITAITSDPNFLNTSAGLNSNVNAPSEQEGLLVSSKNASLGLLGTVGSVMGCSFTSSSEALLPVGPRHPRLYSSDSSAAGDAGGQRYNLVLPLQQSREYPAHYHAEQQVVVVEGGGGGGGGEVDNAIVVAVLTDGGPSPLALQPQPQPPSSLSPRITATDLINSASAVTAATTGTTGTATATGTGISSNSLVAASAAAAASDATSSIAAAAASGASGALSRRSPGSSVSLITTIVSNMFNGDGGGASSTAATATASAAAAATALHPSTTAAMVKTTEGDDEQIMSSPAGYFCYDYDDNQDVANRDLYFASTNNHSSSRSLQAAVTAAAAAAAAAASETQQRRRVEQRRKGSDGWVRRGMGFLIVDDSSLNRKLTRKVLECHGQTVLGEAVDGIDCLKVVRGFLDRGQTIDVILMDNNMPNLTGTMATKALRESGYQGVIFGVTGDVMSADVKLFLKSGANDVLFKPLNVDILKKSIKQALSTTSI